MSGKRFMLLFFVGIIAGTIFTNVYMRSYVVTMSTVTEFLLEKYSVTSKDKGDYFLYILSYRIKELVFIWLVGFSNVCIICYILLIFLMGFLTGTIISLLTIYYNMAGLPLFISFGFPQFVIYALVLYIIIRSRITSSDKANIKLRSINMKKYVKIVTLTIVLTLAGILMETYINIPLSEWAIKNIT